MPALANRVRDTTTTTGTGAITVSGTPTASYAAFSTVATGTVIDYEINGQASTEFEVGRGTMASGTTFTRDRGVVASSNGNALVNFSAGTKDVFITVAGASVMSRGKLEAAALAAQSL